MNYKKRVNETDKCSELNLWTNFCLATERELYKTKKRLGIGNYENYTLNICPDCGKHMELNHLGTRLCVNCDKKFTWLERRNLMGTNCKWVEVKCPKCGEDDKFYLQRGGFWHCHKCDSVCGLDRESGSFCWLEHPENIGEFGKDLSEMFCMEEIA